MHKRTTTVVLRLLLALLVCLPIAAQAQSASVTAVDSVVIVVSDLDRAVDFYTTALTFEKVGEGEVWGTEYEHLEGVFGLRMHRARLRLGAESIELVEYVAPSNGRPIPVDSRSHDRWFQHIAIIVSDMERAYQRLRQHKVTHASTGPQRLPDWNPNAGGIEAFYFKDPDGHVLEVLAFPPGKGDAKWHRPTDRLFLGIDHTAIVVDDTDASLRFYRDVLGLDVAGESENYGSEQEYLNNVNGARLRITALRAPSGFGIEFLEYLAPSDGRPYPVDTRSNDLWSWQTRLRTGDAEVAAKALRSARAAFVSAGAITLPDEKLGFSEGLLVRDPDRHAVQLVQE